MPDYILHKIGPLDVPGLKSRFVRIYEPPRDRRVPHPVIYMFDGQNIFHDEPSFSGGWHLHRTAFSIQKKRGLAPIIIGVDHGNEARLDELAPFRFSKGGGKTDALLDWMTGSLMPRLRGELNLSSEPRNVGIGGSSLGGLAALYAHFKRPESFGLVLSMSPSLWVANGALFGFIAAQQKPWSSRIYLDAGGLEANGSMLAATKRMAAHFAERGWGSELKHVAAKQHTHSEFHWRKRAPAALEYLYANVMGPPPSTRRGPSSSGPRSRGPSSRGPSSRGPASQGPPSGADWQGRQFEGPDGPWSQGPASQGPASQGGPPSQGPASQGPNSGPQSMDRASLVPESSGPQFVDRVSKIPESSGPGSR